ncbi:hypothetical protein L596_014596 [Steinernema carpocapsae]|uniref:Schwannomin interacting protein 1 C-terminal domain-containing protein n=1 Tax=Steinernema carpocapsae TaxID=34508 RepID=A0A4U5NCW6_STECR|nr:hypothetical protein L596_014596 [Steinernema carpocapsae]
MLADSSSRRVDGYSIVEQNPKEVKKARDSENNNDGEELTSTMERRNLIDVTTLLELKGVVSGDSDADDDFGDEEDEEHSNSSSLESLAESETEEDSLIHDEIRASSTSCSENSFEMSSTNSFVSTLNRNGDSGFEGTDADTSERRRSSIEEERQSSNTTTTDDEPMPSTSTMSSEMLEAEPRLAVNPMAFLFQKRPMPTTSQSMNSFLGVQATHRNPERFQKMRESIDKEVNSLDTRLPSLDFDKLEKQLASAAFERQMTERKFLGEQVRRRLAMQYEQYTAGSSPAVHTRPLKSNLAQRLQTAMNLQVCYMNDLKDNESSEDEDDNVDDRYVVDEDSDDENELFGGVPKSKSAPNLKCRLESAAASTTTGAKALAKASTSKERLEVLEKETRMMLEKAKETAKMQMELEKRGSQTSLEAEASARKPKKLCRMQLSRMPVSQLRDMVNDLNSRIDVENSELVKLLIERDGLHMEQDSMLVDIEDLVQHSNNLDSLNLPSFLIAEQNLPRPAASVTPKLRILKR